MFYFKLNNLNFRFLKQKVERKVLQHPILLAVWVMDTIYLLLLVSS